MQQQTYEAVQGFLRNQWGPAVLRVLTTTLGQCGKGWFNIHEKDQGVYDVSKLRRFMRLMRLIMQDTLHSLAQSSLVDLTALVERAGANTMKFAAGAVADGNEPAIAFDFVGQSLFTAQFKPASVPLFSLELVLDAAPATPASSDVATTNATPATSLFSIPVGPFEAGLLAVIDAGLASTAGLPDVEPLLLRQLFWVGVPTLQSVEPAAPWVAALRGRVQACVRSSTRPLMAYLAQYERYRELAAINPEAYVGGCGVFYVFFLKVIAHFSSLSLTLADISSRSSRWSAT
jgi:hypothetical protein